MGQRIQSPVGDYHSKLCLYSFMHGKTTNQCIELFNDDIYKRIGYYDEWQISADILLKRDDFVDVKFAKDFLSMCEYEQTLFTFNHPTSHVFSQLANKILNYLGYEALSIPYQFHPNFLSPNTYWPVFPELTHYHKLPYSGNTIFKSQDNIHKSVMPLPEFVNMSYACYTSSDMSKIIKPNFIEQFEANI
jgi:hypothetical protein